MIMVIGQALVDIAIALELLRSSRFQLHLSIVLRELSEVVASHLS